MEYIGLQNQIARNNRRSIGLLIAFPGLILIAVYAFLFFVSDKNIDNTNLRFIQIAPIVLVAVGIWFIIAYLFQSSIIKATSGAKTLERNENLRVYNLTENLCMSVGMKMPKLYVIESSALNAFASGIDEKSYAVTLDRKSTRLNSSHITISYDDFCLKKKNRFKNQKTKLENTAQIVNKKQQIEIS